MPAPAHAFDAVVLAGGRGTRLGGTDKPGLIVGGQTLLGAVVSAVTSAGADRIVVVGPERQPGDLARARGRVRYAREDPPGRGPVAALACGLDQVSAPLVVLLAADLPFLRPAHVTRLLTALAARRPPAWSCWMTAGTPAVAGQRLAGGGAAGRPGPVPGPLTGRAARPAGSGAAARRDSGGGAARLARLRHRR